MLLELSIKNYALIEDLKVSFKEGLTAITGETGAGKSILLGGLSLVLGKRADRTSLRNADSKCVIEATFDLSKYQIQSYFETHDLVYDTQTIIRREIHPSGKSRAFINDSPVTLDVLSPLGNNLIDIHSQHQTLQLTEQDFQLRVLDSFANNSALLNEYQEKLGFFKKKTDRLNKLLDSQKKFYKERDYNSFLLNELEELALEPGLQTSLEEEQQQLANAEGIIESLSRGNQMLSDDNSGLLNLLQELNQITSKLSSIGAKYGELNDRISSVFIELRDISDEMLSLQEDIVTDPEKLDLVNQSLQKLYDLLRKHDTDSVQGLLEIKNDLRSRLETSEHLDAEIISNQEEVESLIKELQKLGSSLTTRRLDAIPELTSKLEASLKTLSLPNASFKIELRQGDAFMNTGQDSLQFLFSANMGSEYLPIKKVASGGELSRIMLTIKAILASYSQLPTLIFDEIDSGVSGEISNRMGDIMSDMSRNMQVFVITHLPQVASKGDRQFKVFKTDENNRTKTQMKELNMNERIVELAEMLGGKELSDSALAHARQLLN
ncbi:DNA repair protein RecN [Eudoraea chungangensis]|uniref:DNA repair protein RecN n=1 Tax=Eudoraea chungangensis TaxID=1481905 RepID=UPI0023EE14D9